MENEYYYISSGAKNMMHTLRCVYTDSKYVEGESVDFERDYYVCNLSTDFDVAIEKAKMYAGDKFREGASFSLEEIYRRTQEEMALAAAEAAKNAAIREAEEEENNRVFRRDAYTKIADGDFPFGMYRNYSFETAPESYIKFMGTVEVEEGKSGFVMKFLQKVLKKKFPDLFLPMPEANGEYYGTPKKREDMVATVVASFGFESFYGYTNVVKFVKDSGELLVYMGTTMPGFEVQKTTVYLEGTADEYEYTTNEFEGVKIGKTYQFKATVKEHSEYKGEKQTKIQRLAGVKKIDMN